MKTATQLFQAYLENKYDKELNTDNENHTKEMQKLQADRKHVKAEHEHNRNTTPYYTASAISNKLNGYNAIKHLF